MKQYEVIREIINQCPLNHSRDQFFEEIQCEDPESYIRERCGGRKETYYFSGMHQRYTFSEI